MKYKFFECKDAKFITRNSSSDCAIINDVYGLSSYLNHRRLQISEGNVVVDVGVHIGSFLILAARKGAFVYSYEPDPDNYELLEINIALNKLENLITPKNYAVMDYNGISKLYKCPTNFGGHSLFYNKVRILEINVNVLKFEDEKIPIIDFLKLDCEGGEESIILNSNLSNVRQIAMEYHKCESKPMIAKLERDGFEIIYNHLTEQLCLGILKAVRN